MDDWRADPDLAAFCRREHSRLVGLLALYTGNRAVAEELAQEAFIRLYRQWPRIEQMASPQAWLSGVGLNLARSWWRRVYAEQRANRRHNARPEHAAASEPADVLAIRAAVATLPRRQRAALVLRYYGGLSVDETAETLGCAPGTVKSLTHKAIASLRTVLDDSQSKELRDDSPRSARL